MEVDQRLESSPLDALVDALLLGSQLEHPLDILNTDPHPDDLTLALLSAKVYKQKKSVTITAKSLSDWEVLDEPKGGWRLLTTGSNSSRDNGYFGAAYVNTDFQQVVVSHRGTKLTSLGALITDFFGIGWKKYMPCPNSAVTFVELIRQVIFIVNTQHRRRYNLVITGHSLGGWLAQITAFTVRCLKESGGKLVKNTSGGVHAKIVAFDSPGAKTMLNKIRDDHYDRYTTNILDRLDINVYVSVPNRINILGAHLGTVYRVLIDVANFKKSDRKTLVYNKTTHGIANFVNAFRNNLDIHEVLDWAKNTDEFILLFGKDALKHGKSYHTVLEKETIELRKKNKRYHTDSSGQSSTLQSDERVILKCYLKIFSESELYVLHQLTIIQKHPSTNDVIKKFVSDKKLKFEEGKLFIPDLEIDHANQTITCKPNHLIKEFADRLKQVMRWFEADFTELVRKQIEALRLTVDSFYRAEGQSFLNFLPKSSLNFKDSLHLQDFLLSDTARVLSVVTKDGAFEIIRLLNVFFQIKESVNSSHPINEYINDSHYTVVGWLGLKKLLQIGSPIYQNKLMIIDGTSSSTDLKDLCNFFNNYNNLKNLNNLKKLVFISSHAIDEFKSFENINVHAFIADRQINVLDLSYESQQRIFKRKFISTGKKMHSFNNLLDENCSIADINQFIPSEIFKKMASDKDYIFVMKDTRPMIYDLQMPFIKTDTVSNKEHVFGCANLLNTLVVVSGLNRGDLETGAAWEQLEGKIILAEGDTELFFKDFCNENHDKTIYLFEVSGDAGADVRCKHIFDSTFYVERKFIHRMSIDLKYFVEGMHADDMFVVCSEEQKISLLQMIEECMKKKDLENVLHIATKEQEVDIIQNYSNKNIHFVNVGERENQNERGVLEWRFSHGSVERLRPYVSTDSFEPIDELTLSRTERKLVIITDEPGMGKTTSLASLSRHIESAWVIHIEVKQFKAHLDRLPDQLNPQNVASFILSECCTGAEGVLARGLLENVIQSKTGSRRVVLMFDGFDEMDDFNKDKESSKNKLVKVFDFLQRKPTIQIFLTSRKYLKESLETKLNQFSASFVIINLKEQQDFLFKFWRSFLPIELGINLEVLEKQLKKYATEVVQRAKLVLGPDMDCFMGIPLQLRMLAEVFRPQSDLLIQSLEELFKKITIVSAPNLFKMFVNLKYDIYLHDKTLKGRALDEDEILEYTESLNKDHGELGFKTFFSDFYNYLILNNYCKAPTDQKLVKLSRVGLIQSLGNGEFRFIHRTYAEFCCAQMVVQWINQPNIRFNDQLIKNVLLPQILLHPDSKVIRLFMNVELGEIPILNTQHIISQLWLEDSSVFRDNDHQTALHIAVKEQNEHLIAFLVRGLSPLKESSPEDYVSFFIQQDIDCRTALDRVDVPNGFYIESNSSSNRKIVTNIIQSIETCSHETKEMFIFASFFKSNVFTLYLSNYLQGRESSIKICNFSRASERLKEVNLLIEPFINAVRDNNVKVVKEILSELLHNDIERYCVLLSTHKVDENDEDERYDDKSKTALHFAAKRGHLDVVRLLAGQTSDPLFNVLMARRDDDKRTPLFIAVEYGHLDIVKFLKERGADINISCAGDITALMLAAAQVHILTVEFLFKNGADIKSTDDNGNTVLHHAVEVGNLSVIEYFVENDADVNTTNNDGETLLHRAAWLDDLPIVKYLLQHRANPDRLDNRIWTPLTVASQWKYWDVMRALLDGEADVNADGGLALRYAIEGGEWSIVKSLVDKQAFVCESIIRHNLSEFKNKFPNYEFRAE